MGATGARRPNPSCGRSSSAAIPRLPRIGPSSASCLSCASGPCEKIRERGHEGRRLLLHGEPLLQARSSTRACSCPTRSPQFLSRSVDPDLRERAGARAPALQHQHLPQLGAGASVPLHLPQRRDQHAARQHQLDARPPGDVPARCSATISSCSCRSSRRGPATRRSSTTAIELLYHAGRSLPHAIMMLIPEAWQNHETMSDEKKAFYEYHACLMEPWDGPASIAFTDGILRSARCWTATGCVLRATTVTKDGSRDHGLRDGRAGVDPAGRCQYKGRLQPGRMFLVDTEQGRIVDGRGDQASRWPLARALPAVAQQAPGRPEARCPSRSLPKPTRHVLQRQQSAFGYTFEDLKILMAPMAGNGVEAIGSMGTDTPLAVLSDRPQLLYNYFKQLFAQVTNPPLDAIREETGDVRSPPSGPNATCSMRAPSTATSSSCRAAGPPTRSSRRSKDESRRASRWRDLPILFDPAGAGGAGRRDGRFVRRPTRRWPGLHASSSCRIAAWTRAGAHSGAAGVLGRAPSPDPHRHCARDAAWCSNPASRARCITSPLLFGYGAARSTRTSPSRRSTTCIRQGLLKTGWTHKKAKKNYIKAINKGVSR
jgi:hypothetical protein